jgi:hypothetical protein
MPQRHAALVHGNALRLGLFGANGISGALIRIATRVATLQLSGRDHPAEQVDVNLDAPVPVPASAVAVSTRVGAPRHRAASRPIGLRGRAVPSPGAPRRSAPGQPGGLPGPRYTAAGRPLPLTAMPIALKHFLNSGSLWEMTLAAASCLCPSVPALMSSWFVYSSRAAYLLSGDGPEACRPA